jgi:low affinity Fe/Cu permease
MKQETQFAEAKRMETVPSTTTPGYASNHPVTRAFDTFASAVTRWAGSPVAFGLAVISIVAWLVSGPIFHYSEGWQLIINTGTTVVTFLMVFLIQQSANKDSVALHLKLNELLASHRGASNKLIGIEDASEEDLRKIAAAYLKLASEKDNGQPSADVERCVADAQDKPRAHKLSQGQGQTTLAPLVTPDDL